MNLLGTRTRETFVCHGALNKELSFERANLSDRICDFRFGSRLRNFSDCALEIRGFDLSASPDKGEKEGITRLTDSRRTSFERFASARIKAE